MNDCRSNTNLTAFLLLAHTDPVKQWTGSGNVLTSTADINRAINIHTHTHTHTHIYIHTHLNRVIAYIPSTALATFVTRRLLITVRVLNTKFDLALATTGL